MNKDTQFSKHLFCFFISQLFSQNVKGISKNQRTCIKLKFFHFCKGKKNCRKMKVGKAPCKQVKNYICIHKNLIHISRITTFLSSLKIQIIPEIITFIPVPISKGLQLTKVNCYPFYIITKIVEFYKKRYFTIDCYFFLCNN